MGDLPGGMFSHDIQCLIPDGRPTLHRSKPISLRPTPKPVYQAGGDLMRFSATQHPCYCGIDLPARTMDVCLLDQSGEILVPRTMQTTPEAFLHVIAPYRPGLVVAVECLCTWDWLADLCAKDDSPFVLGHALSMKAIHGGKAQNDHSDAPQQAALRRGGLLPHAPRPPAHLRTPPSLLRRRTPAAPPRAVRRNP